MTPPVPADVERVARAIYGAAWGQAQHIRAWQHTGPQTQARYLIYAHAAIAALASRPTGDEGMLREALEEARAFVANVLRENNCQFTETGAFDDPLIVKLDKALASLAVGEGKE